MTRPIIIVAMLALLVLSPAWAQVPAKEYYFDGTLKVDWYSEYADGDLTRKEYYPDGSLKSEAVYVSGKIHGDYKEYGADGKVLVEMGYKHGVEDGAFREYSPGGTILKEGNYKNGKLSGPQNIFDENGNLFQEITYADGKKNGTAKVYFPNGKVKEEATYVNGEVSGLVMFYNENGSLKAESRYQGGLRQGEAAEYYPNGNLKAKMNFVNDEIDGEFVEFYENQKLKKRNLIVNGEVVEREEYDEQGTLIPELSFSMNEPVVPATISPAPSPQKAKEGFQGLWAFFLQFKDMALIGLLFVLFLVIGVFIGRILAASKNEEAEYQRSLTSVSEDGQSRKEFNPLHSESEKMYRRLVETVKSGIFMADINGRLFYVNHTFAEIFGHKTKQEVVGASLNALFKCIDHGEKQLLKVMGEANEIHDFQFRHRLANNEVIVLSASANRIFDDQGRPAGVQGVVVDITEKKRLEEDVLSEKKKLESILTLFENIDTVREFDALADLGVRGIKETLECNTCLLATTEPGGDVFTVKGGQGDGRVMGEITIGRQDPLLRYVMNMRKTLYVRNIEYDKRMADVPRPAFLTRSFIIAPLESGDKIDGLIMVAGKQSKFGADLSFEEIDEKVLTIIAGKIALAIENIQLYSELNLQTVIDPITKIYNYRLLSESLEREIRRFEREKSQFFVLMMDVDDFKSYNDTYGHLEGDELLRDLGTILSQNVRKTDVACRYAGDEFCVILTDTDLEGAMTPAQKIVKAVEAFPFKRTVTISIGIAGYESGMSKKDIISKADRSLYEAKRAGKNKYVVSS